MASRTRSRSRPQRQGRANIQDTNAIASRSEPQNVVESTVDLSSTNGQLDIDLNELIDIIQTTLITSVRELTNAIYYHQWKDDTQKVIPIWSTL
ncbi:hypothetical protein WICPIJ_002909 [Wickerhamomyces pijperi]|uniref:Uncharacterized protein n=1 Tax=Wickerhamomyces pijperi TaxID=599730 RepID=A0A9P8QAV0_WICPI|nr:hypothetical protein WICPIJ_002909 [Wickerhamomyces pijperi]